MKPHTLAEFVKEVTKKTSNFHWDSCPVARHEAEQECFCGFDYFLEKYITQACRLMIEQTKLEPQPDLWGSRGGPINDEIMWRRGYNQAASDQEEKTRTFLGL